MNENVTALRGTGETNESFADDGVYSSTPDKRAQVARAMDELDRLDEERKALGDEKKAIRDQLKANGIALPAFDAALKFRRLADDEKREAFDFSYALCRQAGGHPLQTDLFDPIVDGSVTLSALAGDT